MIGKGRRRRPKTRIVCEDADGRVIDLHAMRTTLGTNLARAGVAPQIAQRIMRHSDYRTTQRHYTVLGLSDTSSAIAMLPDVKEWVPPNAASDDEPDAPPATDPHPDRQRYCQQSQRVSVQRHATRSEGRCTTPGDLGDVKSSTEPALCDAARRGAMIREEHAGVAQLVERQPSKLNVEGSSPFARFVCSAGPVLARAGTAGTARVTGGYCAAGLKTLGVRSVPS